MELRTVDGRLRLDGVFKVVATGYLLGAGVFFIPMFVLVFLTTLAAGGPTMVNGQVVQGGSGALLGLLTQRYRLVPLTVATLLLSSVMVTLFGRSPADLQQLSLYSFGAGFFINAGIVGLYAIIAQAFPTHVRASGTGFTIGVGRGGSVIAPIIAGFLFNAGYSLSTTALALSVGSLLGAGMLLLLRLDTSSVAEPTSQSPQVSAPGRA